MSDLKVSVGFKETKEVVEMVGGLVLAIDQSLRDDGKITVMDLPNFFPVLPKIKPAIEGIDQVPFEFKLATKAEAEELKVFLREKFELADEDTEQFIEDCFAVVLDLWIVLNRYIFKQPEVVTVVKEKEVGDADKSGSPA